MATLTTTDQKGLYEDQTFNYSEAVPEALISTPSVAIIAGTIEGDKPAVRVPYIKTDPMAGYVKEGAAITDGGGALDEVLITTGKIATLVTQSNESASFDSPSQLIASGVSRSIVTSADAAFLTNSKATADEEQNGPIGILNTEGILTQQAASEDVLDALADIKAQIGTNGGTPTSIIINPATEATLRKLRGTEGYVLANVVEAAQLTIYGLPVIVNKAMPDNTLLILSAAEVVAAVGPVNLATSEDALFNSDSIVRRATWRIGARVIHPNRVATLTLTPAEPAE